MARAIWTGSLTFGLVNVPVGLYSATEDKTVHFNQFQAGTSDRIRYKRVNEETDEVRDPQRNSRRCRPRRRTAARTSMSRSHSSSR
jgi:non-homologous end joining protein Ku